MNSPLYVGKLPNRKRPAMWVEVDGRFEILAYFQSDHALSLFMGAMLRVGAMLRASEEGLVVDGELRPK